MSARPNTFYYGASRFFRRNRTVGIRVGLAAAAVLLCAGGITRWSAGLQRPAENAARTTLPAPAQPSSAIPDKSIAVLPFHNLSVAQENAFFADGVQDAVLTDLAKVTDLKVISRVSTAQYAGAASRNLNEIGRQLGVAHVLQGSVQRVGNRVRVSAQLFDARTDSQLWAETYDREVADVFAIESEIAKAIVSQLRATLLAGERTALDEPPTHDFAAYNLYLHAREIVNSYLDAPDPAVSLNEAVRLLREAIQRDPRFVAAHAYEARAHNLLCGLDLEPCREQTSLSEAALAKAFQLDPNSAEAHLAKADYHYRTQLDLQDAQKELELARAGLPNSTPFFILDGNVQRRLGQWEAAVRSFEKAVDLDPRDPNAINFLADSQILMRRFADAIQTYERARTAGLDSPIVAVRTAIIDFAATGDTATLRAALTAAPVGLDIGGGETPLRVLVALKEGDTAAAEHALAASSRQSFQDVDFSFYYPRGWYEAIVARAMGDHQTERAALEATRAILQERMKSMPTARLRAVLAQVYAQLGLGDIALREARAAVARSPIERDAYNGPLVLQGLAQVYLWTGDTEHAIDIVDQLLRVPGYLTYGYLTADPLWSSLRGQPRFERLLATIAPQSTTH